MLFDDGFRLARTDEAAADGAPTPHGAFRCFLRALKDCPPEGALASALAAQGFRNYVQLGFG